MEIAQIKNRVHFTVFSEIWIGSDEICFYNIIGYTLFAHCNDSYRAGGVICYVDNQINAFHVDAHNIATTFLSVRFQSSYLNYYVTM